MRNFTVVIYLITTLCLVADLILINVVVNPERAKILVKTGLVSSYHSASMAHVVFGVLLFSLLTGALLLLSFILLIRRLFFSNIQKDLLNKVK